MRNTLLKKYFSYIIILINNKLSKNNENMRNENEKSFAGSGKTRRQRGDAYRYNVKEVKSDLSHLLRFQSP